MTTEPTTRQDDMAGLIAQLLSIALRQDHFPDEGTPLGETTRDFFRNSWEQARTKLLNRTHLMRVYPEASPLPYRFRLEVDIPYKRKQGHTAPVELVPGPLRGQIFYRPDLFECPEAPVVVVLLDHDQAFYHPNHCRRTGVLCVGDIPTGPFPLTPLLEHVYGILTYQNCRPSHPADLEAAAYFALEVDAMAGLQNVRPLH